MFQATVTGAGIVGLESAILEKTRLVYTPGGKVLEASETFIGVIGGFLIV
jgi:hypothetical protein